MTYGNMPPGGVYNKHIKGRRWKRRRQTSNNGNRTMINSIQIQRGDSFDRIGDANPEPAIASAVVHGDVFTGGISFTYSAQLTPLELDALNGILLSVDRRMRKALGLTQSEPGAHYRGSTDNGTQYKPE